MSERLSGLEAGTVRRRAMIFLASLLVLALLLAACGGEEASQEEGADEERTGTGESAESGEGAGEAGGSEGTEPGGQGGQDGQDISALRALYLPGPAAESGLEEMVEISESSPVNALVVDVKEAGFTTYPSEVPLAQEIGATTDQIPDLEAYVQRLHDNDLYAIARLSVFQDDVLPNERPELAAQDATTGGPWYTYQGAAWSNPYREEVREYNVQIAREVAEAGFDEVQFDYVRFPSDGTMANLEYGEETFPSQEEAIVGFLQEAREELEPLGVEVSADVFGLVGVNDEVGVGQVVSMMSPELDVISPMVYPSHYPAGSYGFENPDVQPYEVVQLAMEDFKSKGLETNPDLVIRPWLQDFDYLSDYEPEDVEAQIQAVHDSDLEGWILWNVAGEYTTSALGEGPD